MLHWVVRADTSSRTPVQAQLPLQPRDPHPQLRHQHVPPGRRPPALLRDLVMPTARGRRGESAERPRGPAELGRPRAVGFGLNTDRLLCDGLTLH